ncbi:MAG: circularly permuted type 2 ATP-grasp protein, partial [Alphaproteobacteria bacterium]|nr:circularly permuted type 2 ATP-grasp protein [Alphaproteobacteria bacterium]
MDEGFLAMERSASSAWVDDWLNPYWASTPHGDVLLGATPDMANCWRAMLEWIASLCQGDLPALKERVTRQTRDLGMAFRLLGDEDERPWPLSPIPLLIDEAEWNAIDSAIGQRADLLEYIITDIYGPQSLVTSGVLPAPVITGSPHFWRQMIGVKPARNRHLHFYAATLGRGPDGEWRVLADHCRTPAGAGYALENRLAMARSTGALLGNLNVKRLASFFSDFRAGLAACCERVEPRIGLLTPGRFNQSYAEQAHLARYLGFLLVEGEDLSVRDDQLFVRTIEGLKHIDAVWRRIDSTLLDPLAFDSRSTIGVPGFLDAVTAGNVVVANALGAGVVESSAFTAFLPALAREILDTDLAIPNIASWWCGQQAECNRVLGSLDNMVIAPAFGQPVQGLEDGQPRLGASLDAAERVALVEAIKRRPQDYIGQEVVRLSTMPALMNGGLGARPFTLRVFAARNKDGKWCVMPGGFARLANEGDIRAAVMGEGAYSADVCIIGKGVEPPVSLLPADLEPKIRRIAGTLPSRAADDLYWLARYIERSEMTLRIIRAILGGSMEVNSGVGFSAQTMNRLQDLLLARDAVADTHSPPSIVSFCRSALNDQQVSGSVRTLLRTARTIGLGMRDRLSPDVWRLLDSEWPSLYADNVGSMLDQTTALTDRCSAFAGLASENMGRTAGWRFHDLGRRVERAINICQLIRLFGSPPVGTDDLVILLDLCDSQISYRSRYLLGLSLFPVRDLVGLE